jgi:flagellar motor switch protein FliG
MAKAVNLKYENLTGKQKAAILLLALDVETASKVFKHLEPQEMEQLAIEISSLEGVSSSVVSAVIEEFYQMMKAQEYIIVGGFDYAKTLLEKSLGPQRASEIVEKVHSMTQIKGFSALKKADAQQLANFLQKEHPQTIALILSHLPLEQAAKVINQLPEDLRVDVIYRIAKLGKISPAILTEIEGVVDAMAETSLSQEVSATGGARTVAAILNKVGSQEARELLQRIEEQDPDLATEIKRLMFLFEDIIYIDDRSIQRILREVDRKDLALALKGADQKIREKIFKNMSERAAAMLQEEIQYMGPVRLREVEAAQMRIVEVIKRLEENQEIVIAGRGGEEDIVY